MNKSAFSLLELSIVLVIIGLIAGGIVAGSAMIRASELRAVVTEKTQLETAMNGFRDKYLGLPGDLKNATAFWGIQAGTTGDDATCWDAASTGEATCNGNGDGDISTAVLEYYEQFRVFQHLSNAGLINGTFTGIGADITAGGQHRWCDVGINCPESKLSPASWQMRDRPAEDSVNVYPRPANVFCFLEAMKVPQPILMARC